MPTNRPSLRLVASRCACSDTSCETAQDEFVRWAPMDETVDQDSDARYEQHDLCERKHDGVHEVAGHLHSFHESLEVRILDCRARRTR